MSIFSSFVSLNEALAKKRYFFSFYGFSRLRKKLGKFELYRRYSIKIIY